ncbi:MAG: nuclear transport factor 2 family protein [Nitriliruptorales bacterium]|nr:nuclear transport factor 2 family protein [Nitriliruptorales bacterium]
MAMDPCRAIENLVYLYAERIDAGDLEGVAELFADATIDTPGAEGVTGKDAVFAMYEQVVRIHDDGTPRTRHVTTNVRIEVEEDTATAHSSYVVVQATDALPLQPIIVGRYSDEFAKVDGSWRFRRRTMHVDLVGDVSQHLGQPSS